MAERKTPKARPDRVSPHMSRGPEAHAVPTTMSDHIVDFLVECGDTPECWYWRAVIDGHAPMSMREAAKEMERYDAAGVYSSAADVIVAHLDLGELVALAKDMAHTEWYVHRKVYESGVTMDPVTAAQVYTQMLDPDKTIPQEYVDWILAIRQRLVERAEK